MKRNNDPESTAERILAAAGTCFVRNGVYATTVEAIVAESGISRSTFYRTFSDLDAVIIRLSVREHRRLLEEAIERGSRAIDGRDRLEQVVMEMVRVNKSSALYRALATGVGALDILNLVVSDPDALEQVSSALDDLLTKAAAAGAVRDDLTPSRIAEWLLRNAWSLHVAPPRGGWTDEMLRQYIHDFVVAGLRPMREEASLASLRVLVADARDKLDRVDRQLAVTPDCVRRSGAREVG